MLYAEPWERYGSLAPLVPGEKRRKTIPVSSIEVKVHPSFPGAAKTRKRG